MAGAPALLSAIGECSFRRTFSRETPPLSGPASNPCVRKQNKTAADDAIPFLKFLTRKKKDRSKVKTGAESVMTSDGSLVFGTSDSNLGGSSTMDDANSLAESETSAHRGPELEAGRVVLLGHRVDRDAPGEHRSHHADTHDVLPDDVRRD